MSKSGQNNQKGIFAQNWIAMSLFLQFLRDTNYSYIQLEPNDSEDFVLVFKDGKKIVCEVKYRKENFGRADLRDLLRNIINRQSISGRDEILVICKKIDPNLVSEIKNIRFFNELRRKYEKIGFDSQMLDLLPRVNFWVLVKGINKSNNYSLLSELINMWLPSKDIVRFADTTLQNKIFQKSTSGEIYSRTDFDKDIANFKNEARDRGDLFRNKINKKEKQFEILESEINNNKGIKKWGSGSISAFSDRWDLISFAIDRLRKRNDIDLKKWDKLWQLFRVHYFVYGMLDIFEKNLLLEQNKQYILRHISNNLKNLKSYYRDDLFSDQAVKIVKKIILLSNSNKYLVNAFKISKEIIRNNEDEYFYLKDKGYHRELYENNEVVELIKEIYIRADEGLKEEIVKLLLSNFNLVEDEGEFSHYSPQIVFEILKKWIDECFDDRFMELVKELSKQYDRFYKKFGKKVRFKGWELMGGTTAFFGNNYQITDRHFIIYLLEPAIMKHYEREKGIGWEFIKNNCIYRENKVNKCNPDFLNRSVYKIVLDRYADEDGVISQEAYDILKGFILEQKSIPPKSDLVYQAILSNEKIAKDKKWALVQISLTKYGIPISSFVEEIVLRLIKEGYPEAKKAPIEWMKNPAYFRKRRFEINIIHNIKNILEIEFDYALDLFKSFIDSDFFINIQDHFDVYDTAELLHDILKKNSKEALNIINNLYNRDELTINQQILLCYSLFNYRGNDESDDKILLLKMYTEVIHPFLNSLNDNIIKITHKVNYSQAREAFIDYASRLACHGKIQEALHIIKIFINDSDPYLPGQDPNDPADKYNEHRRIEEGEVPSSITSVRGKCGWALMKCSVLAGRDYIPQIIDLVERLIKDENWYVTHMASIALAQLAQNRLTVLPDNKDVLFFGKTKEEALRNSKRIEAIAFSLLLHIAKAPEIVKNALAASFLQVFDHIRALNEYDALILLHKIMRFPDEAIAKAAPLFVYYAEFRKDAYKDWRWSMPGLYDDLGPSKFDDKIFKRILLEAIDKIEPEKRFSFGAQFEYLIRTLSNNKEEAEKLFGIAFYYLDYLSKEYSHEVFRMIYTAIKEGLEKGLHTDKLLELYVKCLRKEREFYHNNLKEIGAQKMYWWPSHYNEDILPFIYQKDKNLFLDAFSIIATFPNNFYIHDSDKVTSLLNEFPKTDRKAKALVAQLFNRNPARYYDLRNAWLGNNV